MTSPRPTLSRPAIRPAGRRALMAATALAGLAALAGLPAEAQGVEGCALVAGAIPAGCAQSNAGTVVDRLAPPNVGPVAATATADLGFSISIEGVATGADPAPAPVLIAGDAAPPRDPVRAVDRLVEAAGLAVRFDGLGARPSLNVATADLRRSVPAGEAVTFRASSNYPAWIARAEVRVVERDSGRLVAQVPIAPNGTAAWTMPGQGDGALEYRLRVLDAQGRYDETTALPLDRTGARATDATLAGPLLAAGEGEDRTARRAIPVRGGAVTVSGDGVPPGTTLTVMGEAVTLDGGAFAVQRILPPGDHGVRVGVSGPGLRALDIERPITVPGSEWFVTGLVDFTLGRDLEEDETFTRGRLAGLAQGTLADGTRVTASVDTGESALGDLGLGLDRRSPEGILRQVDPEDVFAVTGDDSIVTDLAPSADGLYLRVENGPSHVMWGDFRTFEDPRLTVRGDRTLTGLSGEVQRGLTDAGEPRLRLGGYAATPETLVGRDVLRGTGGSAYFLSRRDVEALSETVTVELRDPVTDRVIEARRLAEGTDYRFDEVQGVIILTRPLPPSAPSAELISDDPLGDLDVNLVVQYEYVPTAGDVDGLSAGLRAETWAGEALRLGASALSDDSGLADTTLLGADVLLRASEGTWITAEVAQSEGPGFGRSISRDGGLRFGADPTAGLSGEEAGSVRVEGRLDLAPWGGGHVAGYFDDKEAGFASPDQDIETGQTAYGLEGEVALSPRTALTFGAESFEDDDGEERRDARLGAAVALTDRLGLAAEIAATDRDDPSGDEDLVGSRTVLGARLTYGADEDTRYAVFGQATLAEDGLGRNDRLGLGYARRLTDALSLEAEASGGSLGPAALARVAYAPAPGTTYSLGYRRDAERPAGEADDVIDGGSLVATADRAVSERLTTRVETTWAAWGVTPSLVSTYGLTYTPDDAWGFDLGLVSGTSTEEDGRETERQGVSLGVRYAQGDATRAGLRTEILRQDDDQDSRQTVVAGFLDRRASEDWRALANLDLVIADAEEDSFRDGRFAELRFGAAYRPAAHDRTNALVSYTYLYDLPGADQANLDGDQGGDLQRSHILNAAMTRDLSQDWTLGLKLGLRSRERAPRDTEEFTTSTARLAVVRLDYHVVHDWDILVEGRGLLTGDDTRDIGALAGVYRQLTGNLRLGMSYQWGRVSDDLRSIEDDRQGIAINLVGAF